ncbi:MAG: hydroxyacid dehydrogenase [Tateyamaria sp.]|jgi:phosphoglycerate dehydrogenase-like enzyme|nr:hydroxyacid dehydrogenase [Tateyamaria sp.]MBT7801731.1 hydroxyacid dehydrogenase [Tateyamaria sp.]MDG0982662.1 hydroxyacid dehydrogenase [Tateyamaria sp.]MDG1420667.1 hydroxyacid dehydrogenase [Tateyamaria sp.]MDG1679017.1 hydroxyacid dehydrogenase [Tateyamaria sp.]
MTSINRPLVICAPEPRSLDLIFSAEKLKKLRAGYRLVETSAEDIPFLGNSILAQARYIIGQPKITSEILAKMTQLRAVLNVESNLIDNMPYDEIFQRGIHVLTTGAVFSLPVAELGIGLALDLARDITQADLDFRKGSEKWGGDGNTTSRLLSGSDVGIIGFGDLGKALRRMLAGFRCNIKVYDPWVPPSILLDLEVTPSSLDEVLELSDFIFVVASVTSENQKFITAESFASMRPGAAFILLSRAEVVDFDALIASVERGHIVAASDVFPQEPMPLDHPVRQISGFLRSAHRAGALDFSFKQMGSMVLEDLDLMDRDLPPMRCKRAERETAKRMRSRPVEKN